MRVSPRLCVRWTLCLAMQFTIPAAAQSWRQVGPQGGDVQSLAAVAGSTRELYLGTSDGHIFGSSDGGERWEQLGRIGANHDDVIMAIVVDPRPAHTLYATSYTLSSRGGGVYRSANAGHTWQLIGLEGHAVRALSAAPSNPDILVAGAIDGVYRSTNAGKTWAKISPDNHDDLRNFDSIAIDPGNPDTIYAGTYHLPWKTIDGGKTWAPIQKGMVDDSDVMSITIDQRNPLHIFASACSGIYHSTDGAATWSKFKGIPSSSRRTVHIVQDPKRPLTVYAATTEGLWKTSDDGATWSRITPLAWSILSILIDPENSDRVILGTERFGVQVSQDGGRTYSAANQGFSHRRIVDAAVDARNSERALIVLTSNFEPVLETRDGGRSWQPLATGLKNGPPRHVFASPDGWLAAPGPGGLMRFDDSKGVWIAVNQVTEKAAPAQPRRTAALKKTSAKPAAKAPATKAPAAAPRTIKTLVPLRAVVNDVTFAANAWYAGTREGLFVSHDRGLTWAAMPMVLPRPASASAAASGTAIRAVHAGANGAYLWALTSHHVEASGDAGKTWISRPLPFEPRGHLQFQATDENNMVIAGDSGVFLSRDGGVEWRPANLSEYMVHEMTRIGDAIVVSGPQGGLHVSRDAGQTWKPMESPAAGNALSALRARTAGNQLVAVSATEGVFTLEMGSGTTASAGDIQSGPRPQRRAP